MSSSSTSEFDDRPVKVKIKKKKKVVIREEIEPNKDNRYCNVENCKEKKHGKFDECKEHFLERHKEGNKFRWSPAEVGYKTVINTLKCYPHIYKTEKIRIDQITTGSYSKIEVICSVCSYSWFVAICNLFGGVSGCPDCAGLAPWTLERLLKRMSNRKDLDLNKIKEHHIKTNSSHLPVSCRNCDYAWNPILSDLVNKNYGCPDCGGKLRWTLERFQKKMLNRKEINISLVKEDHIKSENGYVPVSCLKCGHKWKPSIKGLISMKTGCPKCKNSKGIRCLEEHLNFLNIGFEIEKKFKNLHLEDKLRVDIYIPKMEGIKYPIFLEFDGDFPGSHFSYRNDREKERHILTVKRDKIKDNYAMNNKMHMIRIPYTCFPKNSEEKLKETLEEALGILKTKKKPYLCLMDEDLYRRRDENLSKE